MKILIDYQGRSIRLTEERLRHILERPEMVTLEAALEKTLQEPELVRRSRSDADAALYYRYYTGTAVGDKWLCVVVKFSSDDAFVLTAYLTDKPKQGDPL
ncbi:MAG: hypothetical protein KME15_03750 [Drouetiella hepatica Uher 2000/2452]|jgi:hypothetical protein|uniref:DUF4258 domain-containing protein n=1 Tax=Drouetiella hepatica Uher 2000/2452 TaxID=904376 RepID=A0A951Q7M4_9CYAN|nr:hypothetical protein [Drouetiella hepatica Uher 2000/2452]